MVIEKRRARNGRFLEVLGQYNPIANPTQIESTGRRYWLSKGQPSKPSAAFSAKRRC
jgi:ribosomal protein S16